MRKEKDRKRLQGRKKWVAAAAVLLVAGAAVWLCLSLFSGTEEVGFEQVSEDKLPQDITSNVIPEYKTLERALACCVGEDVYVIVTRGEKPTSGFKVDIDRLTMEEKDGKSTLIVYANFTDPDKKSAFSQIITYPVKVVRTDLKKLPDDIELRIQY